MRDGDAAAWHEATVDQQDVWQRANGGFPCQSFVDGTPHYGHRMFVFPDSAFRYIWCPGRTGTAALAEMRYNERMDENETASASAGSVTGLKAIERELKKKTAAADDFAEGTVIRWDMVLGAAGGEKKTYTYAALKIGDDAWYLTGRRQSIRTGEDGLSTLGGISFKALLKLLSSSRASRVQVATEWLSVG